MANVISEDLYNEFLKVVEAGDEQKAKDFLVDHLEEFPKELQDNIIMAFFEEALSKEKTGSAAIKKFQSEGIKLMKELESEKSEVGAKAKLLQIKESI